MSFTGDRPPARFWGAPCKKARALCTAAQPSFPPPPPGATLGASRSELLKLARGHRPSFQAKRQNPGKVSVLADPLLRAVRRSEGEGNSKHGGGRIPWHGQRCPVAAETMHKVKLQPVNAACPGSMWMAAWEESTYRQEFLQRSQAVSAWKQDEPQERQACPGTHWPGFTVAVE